MSVPESTLIFYLSLRILSPPLSLLHLWNAVKNNLILRKFTENIPDNHRKLVPLFGYY